MIKNIFLDVGYTLVCPKGYSWWFPVNFFELCEKETFERVEKTEEYKKRFQKGYQYLDDNHLLSDENDEYRVFLEFYKMILMPFPELRFDVEKLKVAVKSWVFDYNRAYLYADVIEILEKWKGEGYKLGIISDNFPSLINSLKHLGIHDFFDVIVKSCDYGVWKPHEKMYLAAIEPLNAIGEESVFVDDSTTALEGAERFGIKPVLINRDGKTNTAKYPEFKNLKEVDLYISTI